MPHRGYRQSDEHIQRRLESAQTTQEADALHGFFTYVLMIGQDERRREQAEYNAMVEQQLDKAQRLIDSRRDNDIERFRQEMLQDIRTILARRREAGKQ